jgi:hypothetical protein
MRMRCLRICMVAAVALCAASMAFGGQVVGAYYFADKPFPEFMPLCHEGWGYKDAAGDRLVYAKPDMPLGGYVFVHFRNNSSQPIKVTDLVIDGFEMSKALAKTKDTSGELEGHSILVSDLPKDKIEFLATAAGHPVWWKAEPDQVQPGQMGQIVIRLRRKPTIDVVNVGVKTTDGVIQAAVSVSKAQPRFAGISFSPDLRTAYLYPKHPKTGTPPQSVFMDGKDITAQCKVVTDKTLDLSPVVIKLAEPLEPMSYHNFSVNYPDKTSAMAGIRAWGNEMVYGMWGHRGEAKAFYRELADHNVNAQMGHANKDVMEISLTDDGLELLTKLGIRNMATWFGNARHTLFYFLQDEPDAQDPGIDDLPPDQRLGLCGQYLVKKMSTLRGKDAKTPILLNIDNTYKPENWYMYHQLADIPCLDPYYQGELDATYWDHPGAMAVTYKPTYVYAATAISQSAAQPKPLHVILCSTRTLEGEHQGRFATPEEMQIQVHYALAAGAKGLSYWWFTPGADNSGCGSDEPTAKALWREIGLLGAEVRTAGPVLTTSCPSALPVNASRWLWTRTLLCGADTVALIVTNDNLLCDRVGTVYKPVENAKATVRLPEWLTAADCFEVSSTGVSDIGWQPSGASVSLNLGKVDLARLLIITSDPQLKPRLKALYDGKFAANCVKLIANKP